MRRLAEGSLRNGMALAMAKTAPPPFFFSDLFAGVEQIRGK
jgi:hypothetical protein